MTSATLSPDGSRILTASADNTARIWEAASGKPLATLEGHTSIVTCAAFSPDGSRILTAAADNTARIWDAASGKPLAILQGHTGMLTSAAFSPDGASILTASDDATARLWDARSGKPLVIFQGHTKALTSAAFSSDGTRVLTASDDTTARVWLLLRANVPAPSWFADLLDAAATKHFDEDGDLRDYEWEEWQRLRSRVRASVLADRTRYGAIGRWFFGDSPAR